MNPNGAPRKEVDMEQLDKLLKLGCTIKECASFFYMSRDCLTRKVKEATGQTFEERKEELGEYRKIKLRENLLNMSEKNAAVAIFLAKNWLGMCDVPQMSAENDQPYPEQ